MSKRNIIVCDPKGEIFKQANVSISGVQGNGKSFIDKMLVIQTLKESGYFAETEIAEK